MEQKKPPPFVLNLPPAHYIECSWALVFHKEIEMFIFSMPFYISCLPHLSSHHLFSRLNMLACSIVLCMEDISYHLTFFLHFLRHVNQQNTASIMHLHQWTSLEVWFCFLSRSGWILLFGFFLVVFGWLVFIGFFKIISKHFICSVFLLFFFY